jgi:RHS repeat-associated protein
MTSMPHLIGVGWDHKDQMMLSDLGGGGVVYYTHDAAGQRVRKVWEHSGLVEERIYLGGYEVYRKRDVSGLLVERQSLHVMDGVKRVALVETKTVDTAAGGGFVVQTVLRFQLGNHLGSAALEVDGAGAVISYEEYHPYGTTAYCSGVGAAEVSRKRYRYTGKEKDEGTGLYYHGARYYACWLGRWTSADPAGVAADGMNLYEYVQDNPARLMDPNGMESATDKQIAQMTPVQLHRHLTGLSEEQRASFAGAASGKFAERVWATLNSSGMGVRYNFSTDSIVSMAPKALSAHEDAPKVDAGKSVCPTCHGEYGAPLPKANVGDDPILTTIALELRILGAMLGDDSGVGPRAEARRAAVASFDENSSSTKEEAKALPTRVSPTAEVALNVAAAIAPEILATSVARSIEADAVFGRVVGARGVSGGVSPTLRAGTVGEDVRLATIEREIMHGEKIADLLREVEAGTRTRQLEHGIVSLVDGRRVIISGGADGIDVSGLDLRRMLLHSHLPGSPPGASAADMHLVDYYFQRSSWLMEVDDVGSVTSRFRAR